MEGVVAQKSSVQDDTRKLAPYLDDERLARGEFGHVMDHGLNLLVDVEMVTIRRLGNGRRC